MCCRMSCLAGWEEHRFLTKVLMDLSGLMIMFWTSVRHIVHAKHIVDILIVNARLWTTPHSWPFDMHAPNDAFWLSQLGSVNRTTEHLDEHGAWHQRMERVCQPEIVMYRHSTRTSQSSRTVDWPVVVSYEDRLVVLRGRPFAIVDDERRW